MPVGAPITPNVPGREGQKTTHFRPFAGLRRNVLSSQNRTFDLAAFVDRDVGLSRKSAVDTRLQDAAVVRLKLVRLLRAELMGWRISWKPSLSGIQGSHHGPLRGREAPRLGCL